MTLLPPGREGALGLRLYRHAQGHRWARDAGAGRAAAESLLGPSLRVPGSEYVSQAILVRDRSSLSAISEV